MKKKLLSLLLSAVMLLAGNVPTAANAEEAVNIYDTYTFEEFLALGEEGICAISEEAAAAYKQGVSDYYTITSMGMGDVSGGYIEIFGSGLNIYYSDSKDYNERIDEFISDFGLLADAFRPEFIWDMDQDGVTVQVAFDYFGEYEKSHSFGAVTAWFALSPIVESCVWESPAGPIAPVESMTCGDINSDGKVSVLDIIAISKYNADIITLNEAQTASADCNSDGVIDENDTNTLMRYLVGLCSSLPCSE